MAETLETLTRRTETLGSIRGIVRTMKTLSAINALPYEEAARSIDAYRDIVLDGFQAFLHRNGPLPPTRRVTVRVFIAFGSDLGLCGNYNSIVADETRRQMVIVDSETQASDCVTHVLCVGAQMEQALTSHGIEVGGTLRPPTTADGLGRIAGELVTRLDSIPGGSATIGLAVSLVFIERGEHSQQAPVARQLLPLDAALFEELGRRGWRSRTLPTFTLPADHLFAALVRSYLFASVFRAAAEALVTENAARLARMQEAEQSVDEQLVELQSEARLARQSEITTELMDVIIAFEAMKDRRRRIEKLQRASDRAPAVDG